MRFHLPLNLNLRRGNEYGVRTYGFRIDEVDRLSSYDEIEDAKLDRWFTKALALLCFGLAIYAAWSARGEFGRADSDAGR